MTLRRISLVIFSSVFAIALVASFALWKNALPLISPIALIEVMTGNSIASKSPKIVYGFFPYWNTKYALELNISYLTHFAYFAVDLNPDGTINKVNFQKEQEPGWNKLRSKTVEKLLYQSKLLGQKTVLTITAMDPDLISSIIDTPSHSQTAVNSIIEVYRDFDFDDLNVDFEYVGEPTAETRKSFINFVKTLKTSCLVTNKDCRLDVDIFADTATKVRLWDLPGLSPIVDRFIVMAYDYYRKNSSEAGPVAPLTGKCLEGNTTGCLEQDIIFHLSQMTKLIPSEKIILGVPFYGYEWQTADESFLANTYPKTGALASYSRIQTLLRDPSLSSLSAHWSENTLSPYLVFQKDGEIHQIHYENTDSLDQKIKLVNSANLGGLAIWALGYETPHRELWDSVKKLTSP